VLLVKVRDGMSHLVLTVGPTHTLRQAARMMSARRIGAAVVIDPEHAGIGILTERDILDSVAAGEDPDAELAATAPSTSPLPPRTGPWTKPPRQWSAAGSGTSSCWRATTWPGCCPCATSSGAGRSANRAKDPDRPSRSRPSPRPRSALKESEFTMISFMNPQVSDLSFDRKRGYSAVSQAGPPEGPGGTDRRDGVCTLEAWATNARRLRRLTCGWWPRRSSAGCCGRLAGSRGR